jgi:hypothetical protein
MSQRVDDFIWDFQTNSLNPEGKGDPRIFQQTLAFSTSTIKEIPTSSTTATVAPPKSQLQPTPCFSTPNSMLFRHMQLYQKGGPDAVDPLSMF